ncbi:MAG: hypothetical protein PHG40_03825 [Candidatus Omnitrophica bacterium]|nr:hypothetical protein [Candidatus Omnitrophota bacterium]
MSSAKNRSLLDIEEKMKGLEPESLRYHILDSAKNFKTSWIELGRSLYSAWKDKLYKEWGYNNFDVYSSKEIGIRKQTALKLLRSYYFLEKEEPDYLRQGYVESTEASRVPSYESVDLLRLAKKNRNLDSQDYAKLKKEVFQEGKDARQAKKDLTMLIRQREELEPQEAFQKKKLAVLKRFLGALKSLKQQAELEKLLPYPLIKEADELIKKIQSEVS